jgi:hypothetical protein
VLRIAVDLDDVLCERDKRYEFKGVSKYDHCTPIQKNIDKINELYEEHYIIIYTARGMNQFNGNVHEVYFELWEKTKAQIEEWGIMFDEIIMGKIHYDFIIDDKAINSSGKWWKKIEDARTD